MFFNTDWKEHFVAQKDLSGNKSCGMLVYALNTEEAKRSNLYVMLKEAGTYLGVIISALLSDCFICVMVLSCL